LNIFIPRRIIHPEARQDRVSQVIIHATTIMLILFKHDILSTTVRAYFPACAARKNKSAIIRVVFVQYLVVMAQVAHMSERQGRWSNTCSHEVLCFQRSHFETNEGRNDKAKKAWIYVWNASERDFLIF
jgi:hypothetical protein